MTTEAEIDGVHPAQLVELYKMGFTKLVGIDKDGQPTMKWTPIFEDPNYWTKEKLINQAADFKHGVATCFGNTGTIDDQGPLYNVDLDIDCEKVYDKLIVLQNPGPKYSLVKKNF